MTDDPRTPLEAEQRAIVPSCADSPDTPPAAQFGNRTLVDENRRLRDALRTIAAHYPAVERCDCPVCQAWAALAATEEPDG